MKLNYNTFKEVNRNVDEPQNEFINNYLRILGQVESGNNPNAKASTSSAAGLYQFTESTWNSMVKQMNLPYTTNDRYDPIKSNKVVKQFTQNNLNYISKNIKPIEQITYTDMYMAHFLGNGGATHFFRALNSDSNTIAANVLPNAAKANKNVFYHKDGTPKTVGEVYNNFDNKFYGKEKNNNIQSNNQQNRPKVQTKATEELDVRRLPIDFSPEIHTF